MTQFRRELLRLRDQPDQHTNNDVDELDENLITEISTVHSGLSEVDVSLSSSHISTLEEELNELTTEQLRLYLMTLAPTTIPRGRRMQVMAQLISTIQTYIESDTTPSTTTVGCTTKPTIHIHTKLKYHHHHATTDTTNVPM